MKVIKILFALIISFGFASTRLEAQDSLNFTKLGGWVTDSTNGCDGDGYAYNDIWGYEADGREYAIVGSCWGTHFIDVTDPLNPVEIDNFAGKNQNVVWRDFKTYQHYAYAVADGGGNSLQIFDLQYLPDSVVKVYDTTDLSASAHSIFIDGNRAYLSSNLRGGTSRALEVLSLADPINPVLVGSYLKDKFGNCSLCLHDTYVRNDTAYCSAGNDGLFIYDFSDLNSPHLINRIEYYTDQGYNHSSWLTEDGHVLVMADEVPYGMKVKLFDLTDILDIEEVAAFESHEFATVHNPFIRGNEVYLSYYLDGLQVYNIDDPANPQRISYYDTYPQNDSTQSSYSRYQGCWGVYPFLTSRNIIATDITHGLFVLGKLIDVNLTNVPMQVCQNSFFEVDYSVVGDYDTNNVFYLKIAELDQNFIEARIIGNTSSDSAGTIRGYIDGRNIPPGTYKIQVTSDAPRVSEGSFRTIEVLAAPKKPELSLGLGDCYVVMDFVSDLESIIWYRNNEPIDTNVFGVPLEYDSVATYHVQVWNGDDCKSISASKVFDPCRIGIEEDAFRFMIYPNPGSGLVNIVADDHNDSYTFSVSNQLGQMVFNDNFVHRGSTQLDLTSYQKGIYYCNIRTNQRTFTTKLVIE